MGYNLDIQPPLGREMESPRAGGWFCSGFKVGCYEIDCAPD